MNDLDQWGLRPLHVASEFFHSLLPLLIEHGADVDARMVAPNPDPDIPTCEIMYDMVPLHCATKSEVVDFLLSRGANPVLTNSRGWAPLHVAIKRGRWLCVERLLSDPRVRDAVNATVVNEKHLGQTALHFVCNVKEESRYLPFARLNELTGRPRMVQMLLRAGADPSIKDASGRLPADLLGPRCRRSALLLQQSVDDRQKSLFIIKARFLVASIEYNIGWVIRRHARGEELPHVSLSAGNFGRRRRKVRDLLAFVVGIERDKALPSGVFILVMEFICKQ